MKIEDLKSQLESIKASNLDFETCFTIGSLSHFNHAEDFYTTPVRRVDKFIYMGVVVKNVNTAIAVGKVINGVVKYVFIDSEKKILKENYGENDSGNVEKALNGIIDKSVLFTYKGNDLAVRAADSLLRVLAPDLSGAKISVIGVSNIGTKIGLSLLERGCDVVFYSSSKQHSKEVTNCLNKIKFRSTISKCTFSKNLDHAFVDSDVVIGCTDKKHLIGQSQIDLMSPNTNTKKRILIDIGKGCFKPEINTAKQLIYRVDIENELSAEIVNLIKLHNHIKSNFIKDIKGLRFIQKGIVGGINDIIIDNIDFPEKVIGKCDGLGNIIALPEAENKLLLDLIVGNK